MRRFFCAVADAIRGSIRQGFRPVQFSVQDDHLHLMVEADDRKALSNGMHGMAVRLAKAINRAAGRKGRVWRDRWHGRDLKTPREVRNALLYILQNRRKHRPNDVGLDRCSSAPWFDGWRKGDRSLQALQALGLPYNARPTAPPRTWLARCGWRLRGGGPIGVDELPHRSRGGSHRRPPDTSPAALRNRTVDCLTAGYRP